MTDAIKIGEPIPLGTVERSTAVLGDDDNQNMGSNGNGSAHQTHVEQLAALRADIEALKEKVGRAGRTAASTVQAHPILTATALSIGLWAVLGMIYRRSDYQLSDVYPAMRHRLDRWQ